jgi:ABC-2 type transport system permease protein
MPVFDQGYQHWHGELSSHAWRWLAVTRNGVRANLKQRWKLLAILVAWIPALALAGILVAWGLVEQQSKLVAPILALFRDLPPEIRSGPQAYRVTIWTIAFQYFFRFEMFFSMIIVVLIGPSLVSQDLRFNAFPLYFSRPLHRIDYFMGKLGVIGFFLGAVAIVPALLAYLLGLCFSLDLSVVQDTWRILAGSLAYGLVVVLSAGMLMLALSSLSRNSRYIGALWIGIWFVSGTVSQALIQTVHRDWCPMVSYTTNLERICTALLDTESAWGNIGKIVTNVQDQRAEITRLRSQAKGPVGSKLGVTGQGPVGSKSGITGQGVGSKSGVTSQGPVGSKSGVTAQGPVGTRPGTRGDEVRARRSGGRDQPADMLAGFRGPTYPWYWSAALLVALFGLSLWMLTFRVKSLDRLK